MLSNENTNRYMREIRQKNKKITNKETNELIKLAQEGDIKARDQVIEAHLLYVVKRANKFIGDINDLISAGNYGLIEAIRTYNPDKKISFISYSTIWIDNRMKLLSIENEMIYMPGPVFWKANKFSKQRDKLAQILEREPTLDEVIHFSGISKKEAENSIITTKSLDENINSQDAEDITLGDVILKTEEPIEKKFQDKEYIAHIITKLKPREQEVIRMKFGIGCDAIEDQQIERKLGLPENTSSQIRIKALKKLKAIILMENFDLKNIS